MNFKAYANEKTTPNRKSRKGLRNSVFIFNKTLRSKLNREKRATKALNNNQ